VRLMRQKSRTAILLLTVSALISCGASEGLEVIPGVISIADSVPFHAKEEGEYTIHEFVISNRDGFKEVRLVWSIRTMEGSFDGVPRDLDIHIDAINPRNPTEPYFSHTTRYDPMRGRGVSIPLIDGRIQVRLTGRGGHEKPLKVSVAANSRKTSMHARGLSEEDLRQFDRRYCDLHDNQGGLERVYEIQESDYAHIDEDIEDLFAFDHLNELRDLLDDDCRISIVKGDRETDQSACDFVKSIGRGQFTFALKMENVGDLSLEIGDASAVIRSRKKIVGPRGLGGPTEDLHTWDEEMRVETQAGRIVATDITRVMLTDGGDAQE
jgi:hypothetical protein